MKQQENMILNQLNQYRNLYLQACNENAHLKHAVIWMVRMYECYAPLAGCIEYEIGRFNVPGHDPMCSKHPDHIIGKNPLLPSFARFYFDMKIHYNVSENRILEMLKDTEAFMPQSSLNKWIHEIMTGLRERLSFVND
jgi:transposase